MQVLDLLREEGDDGPRARLRRLGELVTDEPEGARPSVTTLRNLRERSSLPSMPPMR